MVIPEAAQTKTCKFCGSPTDAGHALCRTCMGLNDPRDAHAHDAHVSPKTRPSTKYTKAPKCKKCGATPEDGAKFYPSQPTICTKCHRSRTKANRAKAFHPSGDRTKDPRKEWTPLMKSAPPAIKESLTTPHEPPRPIHTCTRCGSQFEEYTRGCATIKTTCLPCILKKTVRRQWGEKGPSDRSVVPNITLFFMGDDQELLARIASEAKLNRRALSDQVMFMLECAFRGKAE